MIHRADSTQQSMYKNSVIFFHGLEQPVVGGVWIPFNARKWKPGLGYSTVPITGGDEVSSQISSDRK